MRKFLMSLITVLAVTVGLPAAAFAHVVVTPAQTGIGARTLFSVSVPNEKTVDVTGLKLTIPAGVEAVSPTVHPGWTITTTGSGDAITEISWTDGSIPAGQRDDFSFKAQVPAKATSLIWKATQTYADGTSVAWDQKPATDGAENESATTGPYSVTAVTDDLANDSASSTSSTSSTSRSLTWAFTISLVALALSILALVKRRP